jgi:hypothetical protein
VSFSRPRASPRGFQRGDRPCSASRGTGPALSSLPPSFASPAGSGRT